MEQIINYMSENSLFLCDFIDASRDQTIESLYYLFMHYNLPLENFIKTLFHKGFSKCESLFFRQNIVEFNIIADFMVRSGGDFELLSRKLAELAEAENTSKMTVTRKDSNETPRTRHRKKEKLIVTRAINLLDKMMIDIVTDIFVDFCAYMCTFLNGHYINDKTFGEKLICSFIFFRIITPGTIKLSSKAQLPHVLPIIKILNSIAHGECDETYALEHDRLRNIVARILMTRKKTKYVHNNILSEEEYSAKSNILIDEFKRDPLKYQNIDCIKILLDDKILKTEKMIIMKNFAANKLAKSLPIKISIQPNNQNIRKKINSNYWSVDKDLKYFLLWSVEDVATLVEDNDLNKEFILKWQIDGKGYLSLTEEIMIEMGLVDNEKINAFIMHISNIKKNTISSISQLDKNILKWNQQDLGIWLILSHMEYLVSIFLENKITCMKLLKMDSNDYICYNIIRPSDIAKIIELKKMM
jgi:hypothetical protein